MLGVADVGEKDAKDGPSQSGWAKKEEKKSFCGRKKLAGEEVGRATCEPSDHRN